MKARLASTVVIDRRDFLLLSPYLSLKAELLAYLCRDPSSMMNRTLSKKDAVAAGGWRWLRMSLGCGTVEHSGLDLQAGRSQHSGSSQSVRPSGDREENKKSLYFEEKNRIEGHNFF